MLDLPILLQKFDNDFEIFEAVANVFLTDVYANLQSVSAAIESSDPKRLEKAVHTLKGAARNFSSSLAVDVASKMESLARQGKLADALGLYPQLLDETKQLTLKLQETLQRKGQK